MKVKFTESQLQRMGELGVKQIPEIKFVALSQDLKNVADFYYTKVIEKFASEEFIEDLNRQFLAFLDGNTELRDELNKKCNEWWELNVLCRDVGETKTPFPDGIITPNDYATFRMEMRNSLPKRYSKKSFDRTAGWVELKIGPKFKLNKKEKKELDTSYEIKFETE